LARKALYNHATQVDTNTYPDDGSSPVGSNEWNADPDPQGMLGFTPANATRTISSGVLTVTDSITVTAAESGTSDDLDKLAITNTNQYDLIYLFADTGDTITLKNTSSPSADGQIRTISNGDETLSTTRPTILVRKGNYWYGFGGGIVNLTVSSIADNDILAWDASSSNWINQSSAEAGLVTPASTTTFTNKTVSADDNTISGVAATSFVVSDGSGHIDGSASQKAIPSGTVVGTSDAQTLTNKTLTSPTLGAGYMDVTNMTAPADPSANNGRIYSRVIDGNNDGIFCKIKKGGAFVEVQIL
tara:strand:- start:175 stop:1080 length:906 start_codon:yes stop_codon:yes gene_type:complete